MFTSFEARVFKGAILGLGELDAETHRFSQVLEKSLIQELPRVEDLGVDVNKWVHAIGESLLEHRRFLPQGSTNTVRSPALSNETTAPGVTGGTEAVKDIEDVRDGHSAYGVVGLSERPV